MEKLPHAELPPALALRLKLLDEQFRAGLRQRLAEASGSDRERVHAALHRLVGASGAFGHTALAAQARQAMEALENMDTSDAPHAAAMQKVSVEIDKLLDERSARARPEA